MTKTKARPRSKITVPVAKTVITRHDLKIGDTLTVAKVTNNGLVLAHGNGRSRSLKQQSEAHADEANRDREEWMRFALAAWDSGFAEDEPEYTSNMIKKPNPAYERR